MVTQLIFPLIQGVSNVIVGLGILVLIRPKPLPIIQGVHNIIVGLGIKVLMMTKTIANNTGLGFSKDFSNVKSILGNKVIIVGPIGPAINI